MAYFDVFSRCLLGKTKENHNKSGTIVDLRTET